MKMNISVILLTLLVLNSTSCKKEGLNFQTDDLKITIETGDYWIRDYPFFLGIELKLGPQFGYTGHIVPPVPAMLCH